MAARIDITPPLFWSKVSVPDSCSCWEWKGLKNALGYGVFRNQKAHRVAYRLMFGEIPDGLCVRHKCDNRACVNPRHLETGTAAENSADMMDRARNKVLRGKQNGRCKLSEEQVLEIRNSKQPGVALALKFNVAESTISYIRRGIRQSMVR